MLNYHQLLTNKFIHLIFALLLSISFDVNVIGADEIVLCFGDSITQGVPYINEHGNGRRIGGYEPKLENLLNAASRPSVVLNYGVGGERTTQGVNRIDGVLSSNNSANFIQIMEGTNDIGSGISFGTTLFNLGVMIDKSHAHGIEPIIATLTPDTRPDQGANKLWNIINVYNPAIINLAGAKNISLSDQYMAMAGNWGALTADSLHPNDQGYQVMAQTWFNTIPQTPQTLPPTVSTGSAGSISAYSAILYGTVNPNGASTNYYFQYGTTTGYGSNTTSNNAGAGTGNVSVSASISGLTPYKTYHYRIVASNVGGTVTGVDRIFTTQALPPTVSTETSYLVTHNSAVVSGMFNPNGSPLQYYFEYGINIGYGSNTAQTNGGSGTGDFSISATILGLRPFTTYHYRLVVINSVGTFYGSDQTFRTKGALPWLELLLNDTQGMP